MICFAAARSFGFLIAAWAAASFFTSAFESRPLSLSACAKTSANFFELMSGTSCFYHGALLGSVRPAMPLELIDLSTQKKLLVPEEGLIFGREGGDANIQLR